VQKGWKFKWPSFPLAPPCGIADRLASGAGYIFNSGRSTDPHLPDLGTPDTAYTINASWRTDENYAGEVRYDLISRGGDPGAYSYSAVGTGGVTTPELKGYIHHVGLTGLEPDTTYYFICGSPDHGWSDEHSFRTAPDQRTSFRFAMGGDSRDDVRYIYGPGRATPFQN
jgi:hypothetical protein